MIQEAPKMDSLRDEIHEIMFENMVPLEEKLQSFTNNNSSVEELFDAVAQQYRQKQNQVAAIGKLVIHTIDLLIEEINQKNELVKDYEQTIEQCKIQQEDSNLHIQQCEAALQDYKIRIDQLDLELNQMKQLRQKYQIMYQDQLNCKSISDTIDCSKNTESFQTSRLEDEKYRIEINLLEFQVKQLKLQVNKKDSLVLQKQQIRSHLNEKIKSESQKNQALQNNFKILQQNFRVMVIQNQSLKKTIEELEEINLEKCLATQPKKEVFDNQDKQKLKWNQRQKDFSDYLEEQSRLLRKSISQSMLKKKQTENSAPQPKLSLAFDLQSLCSGTSMLSPQASDIGKSPKNLFFSNHSNIFKASQIKSPKSIISITSPIHKRTKSQTSKFKQLSKVRRQIKKQITVVKQQTPSLFRRCLQNALKFLVHDRLNKQN